MKEHLRNLVRSAPSRNAARHIAREYLQARILGALQRGGAFACLAFQGGTALRFLYGLPRYSEDLDFALERASEAYDLRGWLSAARSELTREGYSIELKLNERRTVHGAFVRFEGLAFELGLSARREEILSVKVEVDTNPPAGAGLATTLVRKHVLVNLLHHDRASLLAGKLHAVLARPWAKGRDIYDLVWYLSDRTWPAPNVALLNNALAQTGGSRLGPGTWRNAVRRRLESLPWDRVVSDVRPFLQDASEADLLARENVRRLLVRPREKKAAGDLPDEKARGRILERPARSSRDR